MLHNNSSSHPFSCLENGTANINKRKRRPAGTPDPDAEVVSLSPKTLLESDRYVCEICNQGFQRDQNLQMHRRRHKVPWKLLKRETPVVRKRVFVCPEPSCLHHDPRHALGDLVGIKKHFRRKHSSHKQWVCDRCSKGYAVQSDYKAHLKTCGTRGHSCDCGRVFSRVESFIEHQDACDMGRVNGVTRPESQALQLACLSSPSPSTDTHFSTAPWPGLVLPKTKDTLLLCPTKDNSPKNPHPHNLELQLLTTTKPSEVQSTVQAPQQLRLAMEEKAYAEEARQEAKRQIEIAEQEFAKAKRIRQQAQAELEKAQALKDHAIRQINSTFLEITCHACRQKFQARRTLPEENSLVGSYISSAITEGEVDNEIQTNITKATKH
ncbi:indeterminate(ID)-domain 16 [Hibiscus trionum]|uniref:Indeterminate(ID)-domain 16 n=2 Tax=Hibiscus trionum TaxID=183268 RepID=A0A9W7JGV6_HIBTR|nr:indeterminate(ID)-domain 16 [Hibiscus trionum]